MIIDNLTITALVVFIIAVVGVIYRCIVKSCITNK